VWNNEVIALGAGVDGAVKRLSTTYEVRGMREKITSYTSATIGSVAIGRTPTDNARVAVGAAVLARLAAGLAVGALMPPTAPAAGV